MDSDDNNNGLNNFNEETNPFYQLFKKQATEFELFGQRLKTEIQNAYQEYIKLQEQEQQKSTQTNNETTKDYQKTQQIIDEITKLGNSQTELIESLRSRVEELEAESIIKEQDIKKLRQDLELNKLRIKKFDTKGKSVDNGEKYNLNDHEEIWNYEGLNWDDNVNENILNNLKTTHVETSSSSRSSNHFSRENTFITNQIHNRIQKIVNRRENLGKKVKKKNFKILAKDFAISDLIHYTRSENYNSLKERIKGHINKVLEENSRNENHVNSSNFPMTAHTKSANSTFSRSLGPFSSLYSQINSLPQENLETAPVSSTSIGSVGSTPVGFGSPGPTLVGFTPAGLAPISPVLERLHLQIQRIVMEKEAIKNRVRLKHFKVLKSSHSINNLIQYTKTSQFNYLDSNSKRLLNLLIYESLTKEFEHRNIMLSQSIDEYVERGVIPELPFGYKSYTEYEKSELFIRLNKALKERVSKLVRLENRIIV